MLDFCPRLLLSYWWPIFHAVHSLNRLTITYLLLTSSNSNPTHEWGERRGRKGEGKNEGGYRIHIFVVHHPHTGEWWEKGKGKGKTEVGREDGGEAGERLLYSHFCGSPSSWVGVLWMPSLRMSRSEKASQVSWLPPSPPVLCPWQSWRERRIITFISLPRKVLCMHEQPMKHISLKKRCYTTSANPRPHQLIERWGLLSHTIS